MKIVYVHGMSPMPPARQLKFLLDNALLEQESQDSILAYWSDILHPDQNSLVRGAQEKILEVFLNDVYRYLLDKNAQAKIEGRLRSILDEMNEPFILIGHSLGSVIAWKTLSQYKRKIEVPTFITLGSPLGMDILKDELRKQMKLTNFSKPPQVTRWYNFADPLDIVASDKTVSDEYKGRLIKDELIFNQDTFKPGAYPSHSVTGYLSHPRVRKVVTDSILMNSNPVTAMLYKIG